MTLEARKIRLLMQLRRNGISDTATLSAIERVPREAFTPKTFHDQAYENIALPIGQGQTLSQPLVVAMMTQALDAKGANKVLEIGTGSGYQAAVLSKICRRVYTIERYKELLDTATERFKALRIHNIVTRLGDGSKGWPEVAPFDRIIVTCAASEYPETLLEQLSPEGGVMILPLGKRGDDQVLIKMTRDGDDITEQNLGPVRFVPLVASMPQQAAGQGR